MAMYDFVSSGFDIDTLKGELDAEIEKINTSFDTIKSTYEEMKGSWKGESYDVFMAENVYAFEDKLANIVESLNAYSQALDNVAKDTDVLYAEIETICNGLGGGSSE